MNNDIFLVSFLVAFSFATVLLFMIVKFVGQKNNFDIRVGKSLRHIHEKGISRFGGIAIISSFLLTLIIDDRLVISKQLSGIILISLMILIVGLSDDVWELSWKKQLFFQVSVALLVFLFGIRLDYISNPFGGIFLFGNGLAGSLLGLVLVVLWILLIVNAINWVDGVDGVSGGISLIGALAIFLVSLRPEVNQPPVALIAAALAGSLLAFVVFNFNPAKILAGTSGAYFMGFTLAILSFFAGAKIATTLLVLAVPVIDAIWVVWLRLVSHESVFTPDKRHLHFQLMQSGWSQRKICFFYWLITALIAVLALSFGAIGKIMIFLTVLAAMFLMYFLMRKK